MFYCEDCHKTMGDHEVTITDPQDNVSVVHLCWECAMKIFIHYFHWPMGFKTISIKDIAND